MALLKASSLLLLILISACGKQVNISTDKLKAASESNALTAMKEGTLTRGNPSTISVPGATYNVSKYSSHLALQFINTIPQGQSISVRYIAQTEGAELVISKIENR